MWEERFDGLDRRLNIVDTRLDTVDGRLDGIDGRLEGIDGRLDELRRHMGVLHEDAIGRIAAISEGPLATKADINKVVAKIDELVDRRIVPLEAAVRSLNRERKARSPRRG